MANAMLKILGVSLWYESWCTGIQSLRFYKWLQILNWEKWTYSSKHSNSNFAHSLDFHCLTNQFVVDGCSLDVSYSIYTLKTSDQLITIYCEQNLSCNVCYYSGIFYSCQFIKSFRPFHSFWEEEDLSWEINTSFTEWHHYHIMGIHFQGHPANSAVAYL